MLFAVGYQTLGELVLSGKQFRWKIAKKYKWWGGAEALMIDALDKVEKDLKKPLLRNDKKGMDLLLAEFDKINKK